MAKYVVAGATGRVGSVVARELLNRNHAVTVIVRDETRGPEWAQRGADVAVGSLDDRAFVAAVVRDASGFFTLLPESVPPEHFHGTRRRMADAIASGACDGGVPHIVMLSALAAVLSDGNGPAKDLHYAERQLAARAQQLTLLRACYFQENVASVIPAAQHSGVYPNFLASADMAIPMIATRDIGRFAAQALLAPAPGGEIVDLFGPAYSIRQVARALGAALGKELRVIDVPPSRHSEALAEAGVPRPIANAVAEMFAAFNAGLITPQGDRSLVGTTPIDEVIAQVMRGGPTGVAMRQHRSAEWIEGRAGGHDVDLQSDVNAGSVRAVFGGAPVPAIRRGRAESSRSDPG